MKFAVVLERELDGGYVAHVPALPGCVTQGDTREEVMANVREAIAVYVEDCEAVGDVVPVEEALE
jgi:predicted RNase H-like HicB family nuclease